MRYWAVFGIKGLLASFGTTENRAGIQVLELLVETTSTSMKENYLFYISKCTANVKILFPVYFLHASLTSAYFVLWGSQAGLGCFTD